MCLLAIGLLAALALWVRAVQWWFATRLRAEDPAVRLTLRTPDGWTLDVFHRAPATRRFEEPIVLCHGLGNNHRVMDFRPGASLARALADAGFLVYAVDLRGAGDTRGPHEGPFDATVDDHIRHDAPAVEAFVLAHAGARRLFWVGHSLGGLVGLAATAVGTLRAVGGLVTLGSPVFFSLQRHVRWLLEMSPWLALAGRAPLDWLSQLGSPLVWVGARTRTFSLNTENVSPPALRRLLALTMAPAWRGVLTQLRAWARRDGFTSLDGALDYRAALGRLEVPTLCLGGRVDRLAPPAVVRRAWETLGAADKTLVLIGKEDGAGADYGHGDLLTGERAAVEVYPAVLRWLEARATRVAGGEGER